MAISDHFAKSRDDKFSSVAFSDGLGGAPLIDGCAAHLECTKVAAYPGGDHIVFLGRVERISHRAQSKPLAFGGGRYLVAYAHDLGPESLQLGNSNLADIDAVRLVSAADSGVAVLVVPTDEEYAIASLSAQCAGGSAAG